MYIHQRIDDQLVKCQTGIQHLPVEILEHVLSHLPHPADLLALALTNRALGDLILNSHLYWHSISVPSQNHALLNQLCANRRISGLVKRLVVTDTWTTTGRGYRLCSDCGHGVSWDAQLEFSFHGVVENPVEIDYALWAKCALGLAGLRTLVLHVRDVGRWKTFLDIVRRTSALQSIAMQQYLGFMYRFRAHAKEAISVLDDIPEVEEFDWYSALSQSTDLFRALTSLLLRLAPTLRSLKLNISQEDTSSTSLWHLRFPQLQSCQVLNVHGSIHIGTFLAAHPGLERFHFHTSSGLQFDFPEEALTNARDVDLRYYGYPELFIRLVQHLPDGRRRPLESLAVCAQALGRRYGEKDALSAFCAELKEVKTLRTLTWIDLSNGISGSRYLVPVASACPGVEEVVFAWNLPAGNALTIIADALSLLPNLTRVRCPASSLVPYELTTQAEVLGRVCRRLERVNDCVRDGEGWRVRKEARAFWERVTL
ncbi:hypothetical protein DACRYDRAFT_110153 [Dacryopinax primogenitus]|uniref:F-box domain-containing protein n=1 Tax=Dacryopinax primogenitus (strain DJM 731) TaxID=1858805 RepID=M5G0S1_DACPD|nr:uncharacterized protein DACRYDRAFT_110153 [Dacryopinax primogenitus]EJT99431.1 hypothetical protein DACRYDRAFT_110153 [Dacryopinax primogenitus]